VKGRSLNGLARPRVAAVVLVAACALAALALARAAPPATATVAANGASETAVAERRGGCPHSRTLPARASEAELRQAVACLVNRRRRAHGLRPLRGVRSLRLAATAHSTAMVRNDFFSHYSRSGRDFLDRIRRRGYLAGASSYYVGEVIATGFGHRGSAAGAVRTWMHSAGHRAALLSGRFRHMGVGVAQGVPGGGRRGATYTIDLGVRSR